MTEAPHVPAAFINAIAEEGTKAEAVEWLQKQWNDWCALRKAIDALYFAAHWKPDRECDADKLWTDVRDAAHIKPGQTAERLGPPRS